MEIPILTWTPLKKAEFTASIRHIGRFLKSGIPICNSEVVDASGRKREEEEEEGEEQKEKHRQIAKS